MPPARSAATPVAPATGTAAAAPAGSAPGGASGAGASGASAAATAYARRRRQAKPLSPAALKQRFDELEPARQGAVVAGASLSIFIAGAVFGWLRRRSAEAAAAENAAARDAYVQLQGQAAAGKLASLNFTWQAERASLLAKHSAERAAAENERAAAEKAAARRQAELQNALAATQAALQEKEAILGAVWAATEALETGAAAVMRRELDVLRSMQMKDARAKTQRR